MVILRCFGFSRRFRGSHRKYCKNCSRGSKDFVNRWMGFSDSGEHSSPPMCGLCGNSKESTGCSPVQERKNRIRLPYLVLLSEDGKSGRYFVAHFCTSPHDLTLVGRRPFVHPPSHYLLGAVDKPVMCNDGSPALAFQPLVRVIFAWQNMPIFPAFTLVRHSIISHRYLVLSTSCVVPFSLSHLCFVHVKDPES